MQISFCIKRKFRSTSYKDADLFCFKKNYLFSFKEKFRSTLYKDADLFFFKKKFRSTSYKDADLFCFKKNNCSHANLLTFKKKIITII